MSLNEATLKQFPQVASMSNDGITYLDSAATSLKLKSVVERQSHFDLHKTSNVHRGAHRLSNLATLDYENSRAVVAKYLNCSPEQIVFTKGTTDSINLVSSQYAKKLNKGDCILLTEMEHHANILPWQKVARETGAKLIYAPVDNKGELNLKEIEKILADNNVVITSLCHVSNTLGTCNPVDEISVLCRKHKSHLLIDGAQAVTFMRPDLKDLDTDFYTFSTHKIFGPFGLGVLYVKDVDALELYQRGGGIIHSVGFEDAEYISGPQRFEPGTPNISGVIAAAAIFPFLESLDFDQVQKDERELLLAAEEKLSQIPGYISIGKSETRVNILSFNFEGVNPTDLCELLDEQGLALRSGHHCTQPLLDKMGQPGCARASFSIYNSPEDVEKLVSGVRKALEVLK